MLSHPCYEDKGEKSMKLNNEKICNELHSRLKP